jgi:hypothetical protein
MPRRRPKPNSAPKRYCEAKLPSSPGRLARAVAGGYLSRYLARSGHTCRNRPMPGKRRCRLHGALSRGPLTVEGRQRALANLWRGNKPPNPPKI